MGDKYDRSSESYSLREVPGLVEKLKTGDLTGFGRTEFLTGAIWNGLKGSEVSTELKDELRGYEKRSLVDDARRLMDKLKRGEFREYSSPQILVADLRDCLRKAEASPAALDPQGQATDQDMLTQIREAERQARKGAARQR